MPTYKTIGRQLARTLTSLPAIRPALRGMSQAGLLPPAVWMRLPVEGSFTVTLPGGETFEYASSANEGIGRALHWRGIEGYEPETTHVFYALAKSAKVVADIGANTGMFALMACAANPNARVYPFEPVAHIYDRLVENIRLNNWQERCIAHNAAVSDENGVAQIHIPQASGLPVAATLKADGFRAGDGYLSEVAVRTLDDVCGNEEIDLIKMDVEGVEEKVLLGMQNILRRSTPAIITECYPDGPYREIENILSDYGYQFYHLKSTGPVKMPHIEPDPEEKYRNYLCAPEHRARAVLRS